MFLDVELAQVFSRGQDEHHDGLTSGFFDGSKHQNLVLGRSPRHRGIHIGRVEESSNFKDGLTVRLDGNNIELKRGDGIVVDRGLAQEEELGGAIFDIVMDRKGKSSYATIHFSRDVERKWKKYDDNARKGIGSSIPLAPKGSHVWKTSDAAVDKKMKRLAETEAPRPTATVSVIGAVGKPLEVQIDDGVGNIGRGVSTGVLELADRSGLEESKICKAIGTLGNTKWTLAEDIDLTKLEDGLWCPISWFKEARRQAVEDLIKQTDSFQQSTLRDDPSFIDNSIVENILGTIVDTNKEKSKLIDGQDKKLSVLARNYEQVDSLCQMVEDGEDINEIIVDFLEVDGMKEAVTRMRQAGVRAVVASPRIIKPNESGIWRTLLRLEPDALLVRSSGLLQRMMKLGGPGKEITLKDGNDDEHRVVIPELIGDFSLNVANALTAWELLEYGCSRVTASYDLGAGAITELLDTLGNQLAQDIEIVAHAHLPIFHTEHCVFARFLSNGNSYLDCGHACTRHNVHLRDETGKDNLVLADMGCRNTVFSAEAQSGAHSLQEWAAAGARHFRIELVDESAEDAKVIVRGYRNVLDGTMKASNLWLSLDHITDSNGRKGGVSFGSFRNNVERRAGEIV